MHREKIKDGEVEYEKTSVVCFDEEFGSSGDMQFLYYSTIKLALRATIRFKHSVLSVLIILFYLDS